MNKKLGTLIAEAHKQGMLQDKQNLFANQEKEQQIKQTLLWELIKLCDFYLDVVKNETNGIASPTTQQFSLIQDLGFNLIFKLRSLITGKDIDYDLGGIGPDGQTLARRIVKQSELFGENDEKKYRVNLSRGTIELDAALFKFTEKEYVEQHEAKIWQSLIKDAEYENFRSVKTAQREEFKTWKDKNNKIHNIYVYKKPSRDQNVYVRRIWVPKTGTSFIAHYYKTNSNNFIFYNAGWLYQWFESYKAKKIDNSLALLNAYNRKGKNTPLGLIMKSEGKMDNIVSYKGGDFRQEANYYQAKFNNRTIISFKTIQKAIIEIKTLLNDLLIATTSGTSQKLAINKLYNFFQPTYALLGDQAYEKIKKDLLSSF